MTQTSALIDIGGSSVKVTIYENSAGQIYSHEVQLNSKVQGKHIYLEPNYLLDKVIDAMNGCAHKLPNSLQIEKIYISTLRQGFCLVQNSEEITPLYLNSDTTGEYCRQEVENYGSKKIYEETGHWFAPQLTLPKLLHLKKTKPELIGKDSKLLFVHDWLVWRFTRTLLTEMTLVSAGQLANVADKCVNHELLDYFNLPVSILPEPRKFGSLVGSLNKETFASLSFNWNKASLFVGGGDSHFLHMGGSGNNAGKVVVSAGSSTPISLLSPVVGVSTQLQPWKSTSFVDSDYMLEGNLGYPGSFYGWLKKNVATPIVPQKVTAEALLNAPRIFGACNMWNENKWESRPPFSIMGDFSKSSGTDLALGLTLDYSFALSSQISALIEDGFLVDEIIITGGGSNPQIQSILHSLLGIKVSLMSSEVAIKNLFTLLDHQSIQKTESNSYEEKLDDEIAQLLKEQCKNHATLYKQFEGARRVLENVK